MITNPEGYDIPLITKLGRVRSIRYLSLSDAQTYPQYSNLLEFALYFTNRLIAKTGRVEGKKQPEDYPQLLLTIGLPGSGKTYHKQLFDTFVEGYYQEETRYPLVISHLSWEEHGEQVARRLGLVQTPSYLPFEPKELEASNEQLSLATVSALRRAWVTSEEVPAVSAVKFGDLWLGRPLGTQLFYDLALHEGQFQGEKYELYIAAFVGGPLLRHILVYFRDAMLEAGGDLQKAGQFAYIYGKIPENRPLSGQEYTKFSSGASPLQIEVIESAVERLRGDLDTRGRGAVQFPPYWEFYYNIPPQLIEVMGPDEQLKSFEAWSYGAVINYLTKSLGIGPERVFIGYNNPSALLIPDWDLLVEDIKKRRGRVRILKEKG